MEMVDSKEKLLGMPSIVTMSMSANSKRPLASALANAARQGTLPSADTIQVGNTVFLAHRGKDKNKNKMVGGTYNVDTPENYANNIVEYLKYLKNKDIVDYSMQFTGEDMFNILNIVKQNVQNITTKFMVARTKKENEYVLIIQFGEK